MRERKPYRREMAVQNYSAKEMRKQCWKLFAKEMVPRIISRKKAIMGQQWQTSQEKKLKEWYLRNPLQEEPPRNDPGEILYMKKHKGEVVGKLDPLLFITNFVGASAACLSEQEGALSYLCLSRIQTGLLSCTLCWAI